MAHRCVHCGKTYPNASEELLKGCSSCGHKFFFFIREENLDKIEEQIPIEFNEEDKEKIEKDVREILDVEDEDFPVILDLESVKILGPGKFQIDIVNLFDKNKPVIYKLEEGKYIIDLASSLELHKGK